MRIDLGVRCGSLGPVTGKPCKEKEMHPDRLPASKKGRRYAVLDPSLRALSPATPHPHSNLFSVFFLSPGHRSDANIKIPLLALFEKVSSAYCRAQSQFVANSGNILHRTTLSEEPPQHFPSQPSGTRRSSTAGRLSRDICEPGMPIPFSWDMLLR